MTSCTLQLFLVLVAALAGGVFVLAFKFAVNEAAGHRPYDGEPPLPRAELHGAGIMSPNPWHRGVARQRLIHSVQYVQAGLVAFGITAVFIMFLCMVGILAAMLFGTAAS